jgi:hypothetical protein
MKFSKYFLITFFSLTFFKINLLTPLPAPKITLVIVIDQLAYNYIPKLSPYFQGGLKELLQNGIVYQNTYVPHGIPETAPGHHALSTGAYPKDHGVVTNQWLDLEGNKIAYEQDKAPESQIFSNLSKEKVGASSKNTMVDTLSDQFLLTSHNTKSKKVFALCLKPYPAIAMAGKLGKAIWFDYNSGEFTSSKYYFKQLPLWLKKFNSTHVIDTSRPIIWETCYPLSSECYNFIFSKNYKYAGAKSFIKNPITINPESPKGFDIYCRLPQSIKHLRELTQETIDKTLLQKSQRVSQILLWVSFSTVDLAGHLFGPYCREIIDLIYHIDLELKELFNYVYKSYGKENILIALTADHGVAPIPEILRDAGYKNAIRIDAKKLLDDLNKQIDKKHKIKNFILRFEPMSFRFNHKIFNQFPHSRKREILKTIKNFLMSQPGIKHAWSYKELEFAAIAILSNN